MAKKRTTSGGKAERITAIEPLPRDPTRRRILVGDKPAATLLDHEVDRLGLRVGMAWTPKLAKDVEATITRGKAHVKALAMLGRRACTHGEIIAGLLKAGFDEATARAVADELREQGWIDEETLARDSARAMTRRTVCLEVIAEKLRARQVNESLAEAAAVDALADVDRVERAAAFIRQKLAGKRGAPGQAELRRIVSGLARRGFDDDDVRSAFRSLKINIDDVTGDGLD